MKGQKPKRKQVKHKKILEYWDGKIPETELNVDWADALEYCWGCGYKKTLV